MNIQEALLEVLTLNPNDLDQPAQEPASEAKPGYDLPDYLAWA